ncbi:uncharacterized protein LOC118646964 isoform X2 [Monomorium pharaonis]|uniref:uncharacterized protein LOC118646964 isoform X2 n=1 Tax=Monomorium pharaonis TaxID=307658 RepID=UPI0017463424|nr:uncharacterized protein LOC118646964 isoform X2 [Monomorium pharaonis]
MIKLFLFTLLCVAVVWTRSTRVALDTFQHFMNGQSGSSLVRHARHSVSKYSPLPLPSFDSNRSKFRYLYRGLWLMNLVH